MCYIHLEEASFEAPLISLPSKHTPDTFHSFPKLPIEIRLEIWSLAPEARVVEVILCAFKEVWYCPRESYPNPSGLLRTNKESRAQYLKDWHSFFPLSIQDRKLHPNACPHISGLEYSFSYFNPKLDTLYFSQFRDSCYGTFSNRHLEQLHKTMECLRDLRYLCVEMDERYSRGKLNPADKSVPAFSKLLGAPQKWFPRLEQFLVIMEDGFKDIVGNPVAIGHEGLDAIEVRPYGVIELRDPDEMLWNAPITVQARSYLEYFAKEHAEACKPSWAIKAISRGGRRGFHYWQIRDGD